MTNSSLITKNSLLIPYTDRPPAAERIAVLESRLFPGNASTRDCAFVFGSSCGTFDA